MKTDIHPEYNLVTVTCSCGTTFETRSTATELKVELCSQCHPFYTGKQKLVDTGGRIDRFERRFGKRKRPGQGGASADAEAESAGAEAEAETETGGDAVETEAPTPTAEAPSESIDASAPVEDATASDAPADDATASDGPADDSTPETEA